MKLSLLFSLTLLSTLARADIVGGVDIQPQDPINASTAALYEPGPKGEGSLCTASVIGPHTAVTAAHCVSPGRTKPVVIFGNDIRSPQREVRPVSKVVVNPNWAKRRGTGMDQGDIALVKFTGGLPEDYHPVPMLQTDRALRKGRTVTLAGYGISNAAEKTGAGILRKTQVKIDGPRSGKSEMILDQTRGHGACHGDSGGPAFVRQRGQVILAGVTNRGYPDSAPDDCRHKVVYTKVSSYAPWIDRTERGFGDETEADRAMRSAKSRIRRRMPLSSRNLTHLVRRVAHSRPRLQPFAEGPTRVRPRHGTSTRRDSGQ
jgi:hypothetical protein